MLSEFKKNVIFCGDITYKTMIGFIIWTIGLVLTIKAGMEI